MVVKRNFYNRNTIKVAQDLLGCFLVRKYQGKTIKAMIEETEAYRGEKDLASHASKGRTKRTEIMYGESGRAYVYMIYGMYFMLNIVTEEKEYPAAILIRSVRIIQNSRLNGPGKLTKFLHIGKTFNGHDLTRGEKLWLEYPKIKKRFRIQKSPRIGVDYAKHCKNWKWNFKIES
jgi:DNA-3-methyladenine glycosylase